MAAQGSRRPWLPGPAHPEQSRRQRRAAIARPDPTTRRSCARSGRSRGKPASKWYSAPSTRVTFACYCALSNLRHWCTSVCVTEINLWRARLDAPFLLQRQRSLPEYPALPVTDPRIGWRGVRPIAGQDIQHTENAQDAVEPILARSIGAETITGGVFEVRVGDDTQAVHCFDEPRGDSGSIGLPSLAAFEPNAEVP